MPKSTLLQDKQNDNSIKKKLISLLKKNIELNPSDIAKLDISTSDDSKIFDSLDEMISNFVIDLDSYLTEYPVDPETLGFVQILDRFVLLTKSQSNGIKKQGLKIITTLKKVKHLSTTELDNIQLYINTFSQFIETIDEQIQGNAAIAGTEAANKILEDIKISCQTILRLLTALNTHSLISQEFIRPTTKPFTSVSGGAFVKYQPRPFPKRFL